MTALNKQAQAIISDIRLKHGSGDAYAPIIRWDEFEVVTSALEAAEKRIAELEARAITVKLPADYRNDDGSINADMFNTCAVVGAFREALTATGIGVKGE